MVCRLESVKVPEAGCKEARALIHGISASTLFADKTYDVDAIIAKAANQGMKIVIPPKKNRKAKREYDEYLYKWRYLVENAFLHFKQWRGIATPYAKNFSSFLASIQIRYIDLWSKMI